MSQSVENEIALRVGAAVGLPPAGIKKLFIDTDGTVKQMDSTGSKSTLGGGDTILSRAQSLLPTSGLTKVLGPGDFDGSQNFSDAAGTAGSGTATMSATHQGGVVKVASGATGNSLIQICPAGTNVAGRGITALIDNARTRPWYMYVEFYIPTAADAVTQVRAQMAAMSGGAPAAPTFGIGATGALSTTNFTYRLTDGSNVVVASGTGPVLDTNKHVCEITNDGTTAKVLFDGAQIGTDIASSLIGTVPMTWVVAAVNGATAANREMDVDALYVVV